MSLYAAANNNTADQCILQRKRANKEEEGSTCSKSHIQQAISAIEDWRMKHAHLYADKREVQQPYHSDECISSLEDSVKRCEAERITSAQSLKAVGGTAGEWSCQYCLQCLQLTMVVPQTHTPLMRFRSTRCISWPAWEAVCSISPLGIGIAPCSFSGPRPRSVATAQATFCDQTYSCPRSL